MGNFPSLSWRNITPAALIILECLNMEREKPKLTESALSVHWSYLNLTALGSIQAKSTKLDRGWFQRF